MDNTSPDMVRLDVESLLQQAQQHGQAGRFDQVIECCRQVLERQEDNLPALQMIVMAHFQSGQIDEGQKWSDKALTYFPNHPLLCNLAGVLACQKGDYASGVKYCSKAIEVDACYSEAMYNLALAYQNLGHLEQALKWLNQAAITAPNIPTIHNSIGTILQHKREYQRALDAFQKALTIAPDYFVALLNLGLTYHLLGDDDRAADAFKKVFAINPKCAEAYDYLAVILQKQQKYHEAIKNYKKALQYNPHLKSAYLNLSSLLAAGDHHPEALDVLQKARTALPADNDLLASLVATKRACCDWQDLSGLTAQLMAIIERQLADDKPVCLLPFRSLAEWTTLAQQYAIARNYAKFHLRHFMHQIKFVHHPATKTKIGKNEKIKLAYISPNFRNHPTAQNVLGLLERHNRDEFEVFIYALNDDDGSIERRNIIAAADHFYNLANVNYIEAAKKIYKDGVNTIVGLMGYIDGSRLEILAQHPCPVQIGYQSYAGTLGIEIYDYFIADKIVIPKQNAKFYTESIINMPYSYYAIDINRPQDLAVSKEECGLPKDKFIYCCFCSHYKVEPEVFALWMKILAAVPNSILWLFGKLEYVKQNLGTAAKQHGIDPERLFFARGRNKLYHLARHVHADLCLDTLIMGAHTTAVDALKMGIPLLTLAGNTLVTRVSMALLQAMEMPELIMKDKNEYVNRAIYYAKHPQELKKIREKLSKNFRTTPLFNLDNYVRYFEYGLKSAWNIYQRGEKPRQIDIPKTLT